MRKGIRSVFALLLVLTMLIPIGIQNASTVQAASSTGIGMAAHAMTAYNQNWSYVYGACSQGAVDCSGLIASYNGVGGSRSDMMYSSPETGGIGSLPNIHGLGLYSPGHVGVYVGSGMAVDARGYSYGVVYQSVYSYHWTNWFKIAGVSYPSNGWVKYNGDSFYYQNGQYVTNVTLNINGTDYTFGSSGALISSPPPSSAYEDVSYASTSVSNSAPSYSYSEPEPEPAPEPEPLVLQVGTQDDEVLKMKTRLNELGYYDAELTTYFGEFTGECVKTFQKDAGLEQTGIADEATLNALYADDAPKFDKIFEVGTYDEEVYNLETRLKELSYFYDEATTYFGEDTALAVSDFQAAAGLEVTGASNNAMREALYAENAPVNPEAGTMKLGIVGPCVVELQNRLIELRYITGEATDTFDETVEAAVKAYQSASGMEVTGKLDKSAVEALFADDAVKAPEYTDLRLGYVGADVKNLQDKLRKLGYFTGESDSIFGESTEVAVKAFQAALGKEATGIAGPEVISALDSKLAVMDEVENIARTVGEFKNIFMAPSEASAKAARMNYGVAAAAGLADEPVAQDGSSSMLWLMIIGFITGTGAVMIFMIKRNPYLVKTVRRKYRIRRNAKAFASITFDDAE